MQAARSISVILPTFRRANYLEFTLEAYRHQEHADFEVIVVDDSERGDNVELLERYGKQLNLKVLRTPHRGRAFARNQGLRAADGDLVVLADDCRIVGSGYLSRMAGTAPDEVVVAWRNGIMNFWGSQLPGATAARLLNMMRKRGGRGALIDNEMEELFTPKDLGARFDELLEAYRVVDPLWERLQPAALEFGDALDGFGLPWMMALAGQLCLDRRALFEIGLCHAGGRGWDIEDPDLGYRLARHGLRFRVDRAAPTYQQQRMFSTFPMCTLEALNHFLDAHDPIDAWLVTRLITDESVLALNLVAKARPTNGHGSRTEAELRTVARELVPVLIRGIGYWWGLEAAR
jgi:glycosyltransferase involved in cell wall biosynthesis